MNNKEITYDWKEVTSLIVASTLLTTFIYGFTFFY
ncbi:hypothetical protein BJ095_1084 [Ureibacillus chungkukjangi]|uniref:Uncharacterized protein n=1 Tax=Ureibacillus chungkukjangi TaxID=1202712 RepID=A0A318TQG1_9BACL|nr:hypothetical protein BJ095_1084 [Ureibacillus chungkukjangi]